MRLLSLSRSAVNREILVSVNRAATTLESIEVVSF